MPAEKTYEAIYPRTWNAIKDAAAKYGIHIETAEGKTTAFGVELGWNWNYRVSASSEPSLRIQIINPGLLNAEQALKFVDDIVQAAIG